MGLKDLKPACATVNLSGGALAVRGLSLEDVTQLVRRHGEGLSSFFDLLSDMRDGKNVALADMHSLAAALVEAAPLAAAEAIAIVSGEADEESIEIARRLVFPDQIEILERVGEITFTTEGGLKKVLETVVRVARGATSAIRALRA